MARNATRKVGPGGTLLFIWGASAAPHGARPRAHLGAHGGASRHGKEFRARAGAGPREPDRPGSSTRRCRWRFSTVNWTRVAIPMGKGPHGLTMWLQPGRYSLGHTGKCAVARRLVRRTTPHRYRRRRKHDVPTKRELAETPLQVERMVATPSGVTGPQEPTDHVLPTSRRSQSRHRGGALLGSAARSRS